MSSPLDKFKIPKAAKKKPSSKTTRVSAKKFGRSLRKISDYKKPYKPIKNKPEPKMYIYDKPGDYNKQTKKPELVNRYIPGSEDFSHISNIVTKAKKGKLNVEPVKKGIKAKVTYYW